MVCEGGRVRMRERMRVRVRVRVRESVRVGEGKNTLKHNHISTVHCPLSSEGVCDGV